MLDELLKSAALHDDVVIPAGWAQGRACYGGLVAALLCARLRHVVGEERVLRSATVSFVGPVAVGAARLVVEVLSPSTAAYDLGHKFALYRRIASLREYLVIDTDGDRVINGRVLIAPGGKHIAHKKPALAPRLQHHADERLVDHCGRSAALRDEDLAGCHL